MQDEFDIQTTEGTWNKQDIYTLGNRLGEWKELVSKAEWNLGAVHDFRITRQLEDNRKGLEQQEQRQMEK